MDKDIMENLVLTSKYFWLVGKGVTLRLKSKLNCMRT